MLILFVLMLSALAALYAPGPAAVLLVVLAVFTAWLSGGMKALANQVGSVTVDQWWVYQFHDVIHLTYQQMKSLLENAIDPIMVRRGVKAAIDHHERLANTIANDVISPFGQTNIMNLVSSRRAVTLQSSDAAVLVSDENTLRSMVEPTNAYTRTIVAALARRADKHLIDAATGLATVATVTTGSGVITYATQAMLSSHKIGSGIAITLLNIIAANELLSKASAPSGPAERVFLYSPGQLRDILAITQAASSDFTKNQIHDRGTINGLDWEGFRWIEVPDVVGPDLTVLQNMLALASTTRSCIAMHKGALGLSVARDITTKINERPDLNNSIQIRSIMMQNAVRVWEGGVVQIDVLEN